MRVPKCPSCGGSGVQQVVTNQEAHYDPWEDPRIENEPCDGCNGTGKDLYFVEKQHAHHTNPRAKERL